MFRSTRPLFSSSARAIAQSKSPKCSPKVFSTLTMQTNRPRAIALPLSLAWSTKYSTKSPVPPDSSDKKAEKEIGQQKLVSDPPAVTTESSVRHVIEPSPASTSAAAKEERDISSGITQDLKTVKETLALSSVPKEPYFLGLAGTLPYLATSISTLFLGWNVRTEWPTSSNFINSFLLNPETAASWLGTLEQIQLGYGAVIISFLGAIHWGLEFSEKTPEHDRTRFRYGMGVLAPAAAWPTLFMPVPWALTSQFVTFTALYMADTRASTNGWAPSWYPTYRFVLTFVVGGAIFISLVGRAKSGSETQPFVLSRIDDQVGKSFSKEVAQPYSQNWAKLEAEEKAKNRKAKEEEERKKKEEDKKNKKGGNKKEDEKKGEKQGKEGEKQEDDNAADESDDEGDDEGGDEEDEESSGDEDQKDQDKSKEKSDSGKDKSSDGKGKVEDNDNSDKDESEKDGGDKKQDKSDDANNQKEGDTKKDDKKGSEGDKGKNSEKKSKK